MSKAYERQVQLDGGQHAHLNDEFKLMANDRKCILCEETFVQKRQPRLLKCLHSVCEPCQKKESNPSQVGCQTCHVDAAWWGGTPLDAVRHNESIILTAKRCPENLQCTNKVDGKRATMNCLECCLFLCSICEDSHARLETTKRHASLDLSELTSVPPAEWKTKPKCSSHPEYPLIYFCQHASCKKLVCLFCVTKDHKNHEMLEMESAWKTERENLKNIIDRLNVAICNLQQHSTSKKRVTTDIKKQISEDFDRMRSITQQRHQQLLTILEYHYGINKRSSEETLQGVREKLEESKFYFKKALSNTTKAELLELMNRMRTRGEQLVEMGIPKTKSPDSDLVFVQVGLANLVNNIQGFGAISTEDCLY